MTSPPDGFRETNMPSPFIVENGPLYHKAEDGYLLMGIRVEEEAEVKGLDTTELGMEAYPDFVPG